MAKTGTKDKTDRLRIQNWVRLLTDHQTAMDGLSEDLRARIATEETPELVNRRFALEQAAENVRLAVAELREGLSVGF